MLAVFIAVLIAYFLVGTVIAVFSRRYGVESIEDYYVAGYRLGGFLAAMTYAATTYSAFMMIGLVGFVYATGVGAYGFELLYLLVTIFLLTIFSPKVWSMARERKWVSPSEMIGDLYGSRTLALVIAVLYLVALVPYATAQAVGLGKLFEGLGLGYYTGVLFTAAIVFLWIVVAGIWSVATTDTYQGIWMLFSSTLLILWLTLSLIPSKGVDIGSLTASLSREGYLGLTSIWSKPEVFIAFTIPWIFFAVTNPQVVQRMYMPRDKKALERMIKYFGLFGLFYTVVVTLVGLYTRALSLNNLFPSIDPGNRDLVTPKLLSIAPPVLSAVVSVSIVAAAVSTLDSIILTLASTASRDIVGYSGRRVSSVTYIVLIVLVTMVTVTAWFKPGFVVELSVLSSVLLLPLAPVTIAAWLKPETTRGRGTTAIASIIAGLAIGLYTAIAYGPKKAFMVTFLRIPASLWILVVSTTILLLGILLSKELERR